MAGGSKPGPVTEAAAPIDAATRMRACAPPPGPVGQAAAGDHDWGVLDAVGYKLGNSWRNLRRAFGAEVDYSTSSLAQFKDSWVTDNKAAIIEVSCWFDLPPEILGGIAWTEAGGDPESFDSIAHSIRSLGIGGAPGLTSVGDVQIQIRHVAGYLGLDPDNLTWGERRGLIKFVEKARNNLYVVARYISHSLKQVKPGYKLADIGDQEIIMIGYMYNLGFPHPLIGPDKDLSEIGKKGISNYGPDLLKKMPKMRGLLGLTP